MIQTFIQDKTTGAHLCAGVEPLFAPATPSALSPSPVPWQLLMSFPPHEPVLRSLAPVCGKRRVEIFKNHSKGGQTTLQIHSDIFFISLFVVYERTKHKRTVASVTTVRVKSFFIQIVSLHVHQCLSLITHVLLSAEHEKHFHIPAAPTSV